MSTPETTPPTGPEWLQLKQFCEAFDKKHNLSQNGYLTWNYLMWLDMREDTRQKVRDNALPDMWHELQWIFEKSERAEKYKGDLKQSLRGTQYNVPYQCRLLKSDPNIPCEHPEYVDIFIINAGLFNNFMFKGCIIHGNLQFGLQKNPLSVSKPIQLSNIFITDDFDFHIQTPALTIKKCYFGTGASFSDCVLGSVKIADTVFEDSVMFDRTTFQNLSLGFSFNGTTQFKNTAYFRGAKFKYDVDCKRGVFEENVDFQHATFNRDADFSGLTFNSCDFTGAEFKGFANFKNAIFERYSLFSRATFESNAMFSNTRFESKELYEAQEGDYELSPSFIGATFSGLANFREATFASPPHFEGVKAEAILLPRDGFRNHLEKEKTLAAQAWAALIRLAETIHNMPIRHEFHRLLMQVDKQTEDSKYAFFYSWFERLKVGRDEILPFQILAMTSSFVWILCFWGYGLTSTVTSPALAESNAFKLVLLDMFPFITAFKGGLETLVQPFDGHPFTLAILTVARYLLALTSLTCLFLFGLALRNRFRIKS